MQQLATPRKSPGAGSTSRRPAGSRRTCSRRTCSRRNGSSQAGFSFIEILIVMGIIGVLVGGVVVAIGMWARKGPEFSTRNRVNTLVSVAQSFRQGFDFFPPGDVKDIPRVTGNRGLKIKGGTNRVNRGIEALYQSSMLAGVKTGHGLGADAIANTDKDKLDKAITKDGQPDLFEFIDAWGNPLIYFVNADYEKYADSSVMVQLNEESEIGNAGEEVEARPWRDEAGRYINADSFQIFSCGPDGEPNTEDDIGNWSSD